MAMIFDLKRETTFITAFWNFYFFISLSRFISNTNGGVFEIENSTANNSVGEKRFLLKETQISVAKENRTVGPGSCLSEGAIVGLVLGTVMTTLVLAACVGLGFWYYFWKRNTNRTPKKSQPINTVLTPTNICPQNQHLKIDEPLIDKFTIDSVLSPSVLIVNERDEQKQPFSGQNEKSIKKDDIKYVYVPMKAYKTVELGFTICKSNFSRGVYVETVTPDSLISCKNDEVYKVNSGDHLVDAIINLENLPLDEVRTLLKFISNYPAILKIEKLGRGKLSNLDENTYDITTKDNFKNQIRFPCLDTKDSSVDQTSIKSVKNEKPVTTVTTVAEINPLSLCDLFSVNNCNLKNYDGFDSTEHSSTNFINESFDTKEDLLANDTNTLDRNSSTFKKPFITGPFVSSEKFENSKRTVANEPHFSLLQPNILIEPLSLIKSDDSNLINYNCEIITITQPKTEEYANSYFVYNGDTDYGRKTDSGYSTIQHNDDSRSEDDKIDELLSEVEKEQTEKLKYFQEQLAKQHDELTKLGITVPMPCTVFFSVSRPSFLLDTSDRC